MTSEEFAERVMRIGGYIDAPDSISQLAKDYLELLKERYTYDQARDVLLLVGRALGRGEGESYTRCAEDRMSELRALREEVKQSAIELFRASEDAKKWRGRFESERAIAEQLHKKLEKQKPVEWEEHYFSKEQARDVFGGPLALQAAIPHSGAEVSSCKFNSELWTVRWPKEST